VPAFFPRIVKGIAFRVEKLKAWYQWLDAELEAALSEDIQDRIIERGWNIPVTIHIGDMNFPIIDFRAAPHYNFNTNREKTLPGCWQFAQTGSCAAGLPNRVRTEREQH
jgi:hypothetical protein